jgi:hypothetical protein
MIKNKKVYSGSKWKVSEKKVCFKKKKKFLKYVFSLIKEDKQIKSGWATLFPPHSNCVGHPSRY